MSLSNDIRGVLVQIEGARLLMPNATISEVLSFAAPDAVEGAPDWLLGRIRWRGWQVPLLSFARLSGSAQEGGGLGSKVLVLKALGGDPTLPHLALLTQGFPRLVTVSRDGLRPAAGDGASAPLPAGVLMRVVLNDDPAWIPDLGAIEAALREALPQAA